jgi:hypothetical protein
LYSSAITSSIGKEWLQLGHLISVDMYDAFMILGIEQLKNTEIIDRILQAIVYF